MRLLFDQGTPVPLRHHLLAHSVETAYERGWSTFKNGDLLSSAEADGFDGIVPTDQNLRYQQELIQRRIGIIVLMTTSWPRIRNYIALIVAAVEKIHPGSYEEIHFPPS